MHSKSHFPFFKKNTLNYLDSCASTLKLGKVIEEMKTFDEEEYANIHRGVYELSVNATQKVESVRQMIKLFINAKRNEEIIFVKGVTEAINLVAQSYARKNIQKEDEIIISQAEHHANIVPWQLIKEQTGLKIKIAPITDKGELDINAFISLLSNKTKLVSITHVSNVLGTINPIKKIIQESHQVGAKVLIDGAQGPAHHRIDVKDLDCDFYCFSGHKMYGPSGIGILYGKYEHLEEMPPYQGGGDMIESVTFEETTFAKPPNRFEAGTPAITPIIGLGAAVKWIQNIGYDTIERIESDCFKKTKDMLNGIKEVKLIGEAEKKDAIFSFIIQGVHPHDAGTIFDDCNVAIRAGHHCAQPLMARFNVPATCRASFGIYNEASDVIALQHAIEKTIEVFKS